MTVTFEHHLVCDHRITEQNNKAINILFNSLANSAHALTKAQLKQAIAKGALWLTRNQHTQRLRRVKKALQSGDEIHFYYNKAVLASEVDNAILISDEGDYSVWYKPYGMLSQGSKWSDHCTISRFAEQYFSPDRPAFIVHRLDRAATGLILIAHSKKAAKALAAMFAERSLAHNSLAKYYHIIVHGKLSNISQPQIVSTLVDGKRARSTFTHLDYHEDNKQSLLEVKIDSGRKHQIRLHAASINLPVVGDRLHGIADADEHANLQLCAVRLSFICPLSAEQKRFQLTPSLMPSLTVSSPASLTVDHDT